MEYYYCVKQGLKVIENILIAFVFYTIKRN